MVGLLFLFTHWFHLPLCFCLFLFLQLFILKKGAGEDLFYIVSYSLTFVDCILTVLFFCGALFHCIFSKLVFGFRGLIRFRDNLFGKITSWVMITSPSRRHIMSGCLSVMFVKINTIHLGL